MIRNRIRVLKRVAAAVGTIVLLSAGFACAQSSDQGYLPPDNGPRSIRPPQPGGAYTYNNPGYGQPYGPPPGAPPPPAADSYDGPPPQPNTYSSDEILDAGAHFFGGVSEGLGRVVEYAFREQGRPTGYILGQEAGGAIIAGLRYGEGVLYMKGFPPQKVYWQGPSLGYDFGANGSKSLTLVYNLVSPAQIYERYGGVDGSAYFVGGVGLTFQQHDNVILAPIRAGLGLRLGANVGYLKYTPSPTFNPF